MRILVVSDVPRHTAAWTSWLRDAGHEVATCPGPYAVVRCPGLDGLRCLLGVWADAAVVDAYPPEDAELYGGAAERLCTSAGGERRVFVGRQIPFPPTAGSLTRAVAAAAG